MKLGNLLFVGALCLGFTATAQDDSERECKRMRFLAGEAVKAQNYAEASSYYLKGEKLCGGYDEANWARLLGSLRNAVNAETDKDRKKLYNDTLAGAWDRQEAAGFYKEADDLVRASAILQSSTPDRKKADELFQRGIKANGTSTHESYVSYAYYNTYMIYAQAAEAEKSALKQRVISDYFAYSELVSKAGMSVQTQESLSTYLNYVVKTCDDIQPEIAGFITNLPEEKETAKASLNNMISLMEKKGCDESAEYINLIDAYIDVDPESLDALEKKALILENKKDYNGAIAIYRELKGKVETDERKQDMQYNIAAAQFRSGSAKAAYTSAMAVQGANRGKAMKIAGQAVARNANNCGTSTFERKCNYIYAVQLLQQATGESVGGLISSYKANYPTKDDCFNEGSPSSVSLSCYGVTVNPCQ